MKRTITCDHPLLIPTGWNQPKPESYVGETCDCGKNFTCPVCGQGFGCYPCDCTKELQTKIENLQIVGIEFKCQ